MNNNKDIERLVKEAYLNELEMPDSAKMEQKVLQDAEVAMDQAQNKEPRGEYLPHIRILTMRNTTVKLISAAILVIGILVGFSVFYGGGSGIVLAEVIQAIRGKSYTFELVENGLGTDRKVDVMVHEPGVMRFDLNSGTGKISCIIDTAESSTLILMHSQKAAIEKKLGPDTYVGATAIFGLCMSPVENLWNLRDGSEESLGTKEIDGVKCKGFLVKQQDDQSTSEISIWADTKTAKPVKVSIISNLKGREDTLDWTLSKFELDAGLDENLFSLATPAGYASVYEKTLEELPVAGETSIEANKVLDVLNTCKAGQMDRAIEMLLAVDWSSTFEFASDAYLFSLTEQDYMSLVPADQREVLEKVMDDEKQVRTLIHEISTKIMIAQDAGDNRLAEKYLNSGLELGRLLDADPDRMLIIRMVGMAVQKMMLNASINLYENTKQQSKLQKAQEALDAVNAESEAIRNKAQGK